MNDLLEQEPAFFDFPQEGCFDFDMMEAEPSPVEPLGEHVSTSDEYLDSPLASPQRLDSEPSTLPFLPLQDDLPPAQDDFFAAAFPPEPLLAEDAPMEVEVKAEPIFDPAPAPAPASPIAPLESEDAARGRKRKAPSTPNSKAARVKLEQGRVISKDEMASMSADELEEYAQQLQGANLSAHERNEIRRQLRLIKNRESAQASRQRKKSYIEELERKVNALQSENDRLRAGINNLNAENGQLKTQVDVFQKFVASTGVGKILASGASLLSKVASKPASPATSPSSPTSPSAAPAHGLNPRQTGMLLMVMLFSFGLLFNTQLGLGKNKQLALPPSTELATTGRVLDHPQFVPTSENRKLHQLYEKAEMPTHRIVQRIQEQSEMPTAASHAIEREEAKPVAPKAAVPASQPVIAEWKANTTYLLCPEVQRLTPPKEVAEDPNAPLQVAFLIPPDALGASSRGPAREYLEVTCQVTSVATRPLQRFDSNVVEVHS